MAATPTPDGFHSKASRKESLNTLSFIEPELRAGDTVLDIGCGYGYVCWRLGQHHDGRVIGVDIVDTRKKPTPEFLLYDGVHLPLPDASCDVAVLSFVLHHVPNALKPAVIAEARRVVRRTLVVLEDTPRNFFDRYHNRKHGETYRATIGSTADFGFYTRGEWAQFFAAHGFQIVREAAIPRFARDWRQPYARTCFVLSKAGGATASDPPPADAAPSRAP